MSKAVETGHKEDHRDVPLRMILLKGGQVDFMPTTSVVPPPLATPKTIVVSSRSSPVSGAAATPLMEHVTRLLMILWGLPSWDLVH